MSYEIAISQLKISLANVEAGLPSWRAEGSEAQVALGERSAESYRVAIAKLEEVGG